MTAQPAFPESRQGVFCDECGAYAIRRRSLHAGIAEFRCDACQRELTQRVLPLCIVTGASGVGKTTILPHLQRLLPEYGVLDKDAMWARDWDMAYNNLFRVASALAQGGRGTVIVGTIIPAHIDGLSDRDLVGRIAYANLHCDDATRARRLRHRRTWGLPDPAFIDAHREFAQWLLDNAAQRFVPPMPTFDTTATPPGEVAVGVAAWVRAHLETSGASG
jgi:energy-coupling factor transporter ATP-binding protein EcfA2